MHMKAEKSHKILVKSQGVYLANFHVTIISAEKIALKIAAKIASVNRP